MAGTPRSRSCSISDRAAVVLPLPEPPRNATCCLSSDGSIPTTPPVSDLACPSRSGPAGAACGRAAGPPGSAGSAGEGGRVGGGGDDGAAAAGAAAGRAGAGGGRLSKSRIFRRDGNWLSGRLARCQFSNEESWLRLPRKVPKASIARQSESSTTVRRPPRAMICAICLLITAVGLLGNAVERTMTRGTAPARCSASVTCRASPPPWAAVLAQRRSQLSCAASAIPRRAFDLDDPVVGLGGEACSIGQLVIAPLDRGGQQLLLAHSHRRAGPPETKTADRSRIAPSARPGRAARRAPDQSRAGLKRATAGRTIARP